MLACSLQPQDRPEPPRVLSDGRFTLGLGADENLNEHIVGGRWPLAGMRHQMLEEAVEIIRALWAGGTVTYRGKHFDVESARVWDLPETAPPIGIAVSGPSAVGWRDGTPTP